MITFLWRKEKMVGKSRHRKGSTLCSNPRSPRHGTWTHRKVLCSAVTVHYNCLQDYRVKDIELEIFRNIPLNFIRGLPKSPGCAGQRFYANQTGGSMWGSEEVVLLEITLSVLRLGAAFASAGGTHVVLDQTQVCRWQGKSLTRSSVSLLRASFLWNKFSSPLVSLFCPPAIYPSVLVAVVGSRQNDLSLPCLTGRSNPTYLPPSFGHSELPICVDNSLGSSSV